MIRQNRFGPSETFPINLSACGIWRLLICSQSHHYRPAVDWPAVNRLRTLCVLHSAGEEGGIGADEPVAAPPAAASLKFAAWWQSTGLRTVLRTLAFQLLLVNICTGPFNYDP